MTMMVRRHRAMAWLVLLAVCAGVPAWAQQEAPGAPAETPPDKPQGQAPVQTEGMMSSLGSSERPWAQGVTPEQQESARRLFEEGNALLQDSLFAQAAAKYREALAHWNHPGIHYNLALALISLDQPIEVYQALDKAMQYGEAPLDAEKLERARTYRTLLEQQLGRIEIVCEEPDAQVSLDGKVIFRGPGTHRTLMRVGEHTAVALKQGYLTRTRPFVMLPGKEVRLELKLISLDDATGAKRRWASWKPWAVAGAGAGVGLLGGVLYWRASANFDSYDQQFGELCSNGCQPDEISDDLDGTLSRAEWQQRIAIGSYVIGGAALATGLIMTYLNQPQVERRFIEDEPMARIAPVLGPGIAGVSAGIRF